MGPRDSFGASMLLEENASPGELFSAEEQQDIEEELQVGHCFLKAFQAAAWLRQSDINAIYPAGIFSL